MTQQLTRRMMAPPAAAPPEVSRRPFATHPVEADRDRRAGVERVIELARWAVLVYAAVSNNFPGQPHTSTTSAVNLILGGWCLFNLSATLALLIHHLPGRNTQLAMLGMDLVVASALVYLSGGFGSNLAVVFYVLIGLSSLRFGVLGSLLCAVTISALYVGVGLADASGPIDHTLVNVIASRLFLFFVVSLASALLAREMVTARAQQMAHTAELEHAVFAELCEVDRIKSEFMMLASHELRTPLTSMRGYAELLRRNPDMSAEDMTLAMRRIDEETQRMGILVDDLLLLARLDQGRPLESRPVDLEALVADACADARAAEGGRPISTRVTAPLVVDGDQMRLRQVLSNLLRNALVHTPEGTPIEVRLRRDDGSAVLEVVDHGPGIQPEHAGRIFERFYRADAARSGDQGGSGLGLSIAAAVVQAHGGRITLDRTPGGGATFRIVLPLPDGHGVR